MLITVFARTQKCPGPGRGWNILILSWRQSHALGSLRNFQIFCANLAPNIKVTNLFYYYRRFGGEILRFSLFFLAFNFSSKCLFPQFFPRLRIHMWRNPCLNYYLQVFYNRYISILVFNKEKHIAKSQPTNQTLYKTCKRKL